MLQCISGAISPRVEQQATRELVILGYRAGRLPITAPLTLLKHYLAEHPDDYLRSQDYFEPYPDTWGALSHHLITLRIANGG